MCETCRVVDIRYAPQNAGASDTCKAAYGCMPGCARKRTKSEQQARGVLSIHARAFRGESGVLREA
eukprot:5387862-Pleurochrysis_carterae.AAC.6